MLTEQIHIRSLQQSDYLPVWQQMQAFTEQRTANSIDEIWLIEHAPVYTLGQAGKPEHILNPGKIPVLHVDRGGQVTYHGPGQLMVYTLLDLRRRSLGVRELVSSIENSVIALLADYQIEAYAKREAPGIYVNAAKIGSIGLRVRRGCSYHGLAFNIAMDLLPFKGINPCGFANLTVTQLADLGGPTHLQVVAPLLVNHLIRILGYTNPIYIEHTSYGQSYRP